MKHLLSFLNIATAFIFNLISILFTFIAWLLKCIGIMLVHSADAVLDLLNNIGSQLYVNQISDVNTKRK